MRYSKTSYFLQSQVREETIKRTYGAQAPAQFAVFPARHITAAMRALTEPVTAEILIPHKGPSQVINIPVGTQELRNVHLHAAIVLTEKEREISWHCIAQVYEKYCVR